MARLPRLNPERNAADAERAAKSEATHNAEREADRKAHAAINASDAEAAREARRARASQRAAQGDDALSVTVYTPDSVDAASKAAEAFNMSGGGHIPPHVWAMLQTAGELAASKLVDILNSPAFAKAKLSDQRAILDLALTRAFGLPVRRELKVELSSTEGDAIAQSLNRLAGRVDLPEHTGRKRSN